MVVKCPSTNTAAIEQDEFFLNFHFNAGLQPHEIGWLVAGAAAAITLILSLSNVLAHAHHYTRPLEQRQIIRILLFAPIYAVVSFFGYRYFREYEYFELGEVAMEAIAISAFLILLLQYIGDAVEDLQAVFGQKDKTKMPFPFCCWRYRPSKAYFLVLLKWSVLQYVLIRPLLSVAGVILQYYDLLCTQTYSYKYGEVYLAAVDFVSISIALYGLIVLYALLKDDLDGRKPLAKFLTIKLAIFFTFYQSFVFSVLQDHGVLKPTEYWTSTNIANGLNALCTSVEMIIVAVWQLFAFPASEYTLKNLAKPLKKKKAKKGKKGKSGKGEEEDEEDDIVGDGTHDMELSAQTPNEKSAIVTQGALPGHSPSALEMPPSFLPPPIRPSAFTSHSHTPSFIQQQPQQDRLRGVSHVIPGTSVGKTNARGHTNILRSLLHALNLSDFIVELWHSFRFAFDRIRGKSYTREDMRFGRGKFDFEVFRHHQDQAEREREGGLGQSRTVISGPSNPQDGQMMMMSSEGGGEAGSLQAPRGHSDYNNSYYSGSSGHPALMLDPNSASHHSGPGGLAGPGPSTLSRMMVSSSSNADLGAGAGGVGGAGSYQPLRESMDVSQGQGQGQQGYAGYGTQQPSYGMYPNQYNNHNHPDSGFAYGAAGVGSGVPRPSMADTATSTAVDSLTASSPIVPHSTMHAAPAPIPSSNSGFYERNAQGQKIEMGPTPPSTAGGTGTRKGSLARDSTEVRMQSFAFPNSSSASSVRTVDGAGVGAGAGYTGVTPTIVLPGGEGLYQLQQQQQQQQQGYGAPLARPDSRFSASVYDEDEGSSARVSGTGSAMGMGMGMSQPPQQGQYQPQLLQQQQQPYPQQQHVVEPGFGGQQQDGYGYGYQDSMIQEGGAFFANAGRMSVPASAHRLQQEQSTAAAALPQFSIHPPPVEQQQPLDQNWDQNQHRQTMHDLQRAMKLTPSAQSHNPGSAGSSDAGASSSQRSSAALSSGGGHVQFDEYGRPRSWEPQAL
ncbi:hypothetical protein A4X09_0g1424 [Tilletia walkeri]|uniref:DUF300-domain-containing protein n=1 Tax=Tilletia walkeri TaxID=117179 RepID=A0A8X7NBX3_9BASI|nr:hypothetical protein A4X09_0g1424 [Tilletia walkeri]